MYDDELWTKFKDCEYPDKELTTQVYEEDSVKIFTKDFENESKYMKEEIEEELVASFVLAKDMLL